MTKENTWRAQYIEELAKGIEDYKETKDFYNWLMSPEYTWRYESFKRECKNLNTEEDFYYICVDFCIPLIFLKKLLKDWEEV